MSTGAKEPGGPEEFEGDLRGAVFWGADLRSARFRDVNLTEATITHAWLVDVEIDAFIDRVVINGVDVTAFVNEHDRWYPLRAVLSASDPESMRAGWAALREAWAASVERARRLPDDDVKVSVDGEWSFVQTLRHLLFATDKWFTAPILGRPFHPLGLPNSGSIDFPWPDLDLEAAPSLSEVLAARADQATRLGDHLAAITAEDLTRTVDVLENGPHLVRDCVATVLEEEFWHHRYAERDLATLETKR
ncbi:MAG: DinB family protein [Ilumatobacteraceae bacterium]